MGRKEGEIRELQFLWRTCPHSREEEPESKDKSAPPAGMEIQPVWKVLKLSAQVLLTLHAPALSSDPFSRLHHPQTYCCSHHPFFPLPQTSTLGNHIHNQKSFLCPTTRCSSEHLDAQTFSHTSHLDLWTLRVLAQLPYPCSPCWLAEV
jgi:hypothetical protein